MALAFRNLTITPGTPVSEWPTEAVQAALERGDHADWHRIVAEIQADPWGRTARQVEEVLSHSRPYGVAQAMETPPDLRRPVEILGLVHIGAATGAEEPQDPNGTKLFEAIRPGGSTTI